MCHAAQREALNDSSRSHGGGSWEKMSHLTISIEAQGTAQRTKQTAHSEDDRSCPILIAKLALADSTRKHICVLGGTGRRSRVPGRIGDYYEYC